MNLYNLRMLEHGHFQMAKFDKDFNVEAVYDLVMNGKGDYKCNCPANNRTVVLKPCKHRKMMPYMLGAVNTSRFFEPETRSWHQPIEVAPEQAEIESHLDLPPITPIEAAPQASIDPIERAPIQTAAAAPTGLRRRI